MKVKKALLIWTAAKVGQCRLRGAFFLWRPESCQRQQAGYTTGE
ncbi:hypothetical protein BN1182_AS_00760 [Pantoea ananatis]|nr:hypothetical protein BN1182_AS_00760 [Pantoea ananatis]